jgi:hypothetical protein
MSSALLEATELSALDSKAAHDVLVLRISCVVELNLLC